MEECPTQKIVGICWGHQVINVTFGGVVGPMDNDKFEVCSFLDVKARHRACLC